MSICGTTKFNFSYCVIVLFICHKFMLLLHVVGTLDHCRAATSPLANMRCPTKWISSQLHMKKFLSIQDISFRALGPHVGIAWRADCDYDASEWLVSICWLYLAVKQWPRDLHLQSADDVLSVNMHRRPLYSAAVSGSRSVFSLCFHITFGYMKSIWLMFLRIHPLWTASGSESSQWPRSIKLSLS